MKLTHEQVQYIDKFLESRGVHYIDIRHELTDHIVTALEETQGDFNDNFIAYRIANQDKILKHSERLHILSMYKAGRYLLKNIGKPANAIIMISVFLICNYIINTYSPNTMGFLSHALGFFSLPFVILNKRIKKVSIPKNILYGLSFLYMIIPFVIIMSGFVLGNMPVVIIIARHAFSFLMALITTGIVLALRYNNYNYSLH